MDKEITTEIENGGNIITITIIPSYIYDHMIKKYVSINIEYYVIYIILQIFYHNYFFQNE